MTIQRLNAVLETISSMNLKRWKYNLLVIFRDDLEVVFRQWNIKQLPDQAQVIRALAKHGVMVI